MKLILQIPRPRFEFLHLSISNGFVSSKIYDKRDNFDFDIVILPFFSGWQFPRRPSYGVCFSQLIRFARVCSHVEITRKQRSGTEAIRTQIQPSKREITKLTNNQNIKRTYGKPGEQRTYGKPG